MTERSTKLLRFAFWLNFSFAIFEVIGGWWSGSLAITSDALHDFGDSISLGIAWYLQRLSQRKSDDKFSFGYARFSTLGALVNAMILFLGSIYIFYLSITSIGEHEMPMTEWMFGIAIVGIVINGIAFKSLHQGSSLNEKTAALHLLEDVLGWVAVLVGAVIMYFTDAAWIDPAMSMAIALWIGINSVRQIRKSSSVFLQSVPPGIDLEEVRTSLVEDDRISEVHNVRVWSLDGSDHHVVSVHVVLKDDLRISEIDRIRKELRATLKSKGLSEVTLQFEAPGGEIKNPE